MKSIFTALALAAALALTGGPALAEDCFQQMMTRTNQMISEAEQQGGMEKSVKQAKKQSAEAQKLYDQGKHDEAMVRLARSMDTLHSGGYHNR